MPSLALGICELSPKLFLHQLNACINGTLVSGESTKFIQNRLKDLVEDHFINSHNLFPCLCINIVRRLRACLHGGGGPRVGEVTLFGG